MIKRYDFPEISKIWTDESKFNIWLEIETKILEVLEEHKEVPNGVTKEVKTKAKVNVDRILELEKTTKHDVVAFVNSILEQLDKARSFFHLGVTSSDIVDTCFSIQMQKSLDVILYYLRLLMKEVRKKAKKYKDIVSIGRTHGIHAEPMKFGLKFLLFFDELKRHYRRIKRAKSRSRYGMISGAVGVYSLFSPIYEKEVLRKLGLKQLNITTQVIPRDIYAEVFLSLALLASSVERFAVELRHLQRTEVSEIREEFTKGQTGSSAMPHKKNPISAENLTGIARLIRSSVIPALENIALWHERDISHSSVERVLGPDITVLTGYMLNRLRGVVERLVVNLDNIEKNLNLTHGMVFSSKVLWLLMKKGVPRDKAYKIVQSSAFLLDEKLKDNPNITFKDILKQNKDAQVIWEDLDKIFDYDDMLKYVNHIYKRVLKEDLGGLK